MTRRLSCSVRAWVVAALAAGVREDLQQLLLSDRHAFLQAIKNRSRRHGCSIADQPATGSTVTGSGYRALMAATDASQAA